MPSAFRFCSRLFIAVYGRFPLLGELRSSVAIIQRGSEFLLQQRGDRLGWAFPGGVSWFWESPEQTLRREILEETGLRVESCRLLFTYRDRNYIPSRVSVFAAEASGELHGSWEGQPQWVSADPLPTPFFPAQQAILDYLRTG